MVGYSISYFYSHSCYSKVHETNEQVVRGLRFLEKFRRAIKPNVVWLITCQHEYRFDLPEGKSLKVV